MTAVFLKLAEAREVMGHRFGWEVAGCGAFIAAILITLGANAAFGVTGLSPYGTRPLAGSSASPLPSLSQGEIK